MLTILRHRNVGYILPPASGIFDSADASPWLIQSLCLGHTRSILVEAWQQKAPVPVCSVLDNAGITWLVGI